MRKYVAIVAIIAALVTAYSANAQPASWPTRSVKLILPLGAGSGTDTVARLFADRLSAKWSKPVVVENKPGGDGIVAISSFLNTGDDHTLLLTATSAFTAHRYLHEKIPYDPDDLIPVARIADSLVVLAVPTSLPVNSLQDLVSLAKKREVQLNVASITGLLDLVFSSFIKRHDLAIAKVPYRDPVQAINDLSEARIQIMVTSLAIVRAQVDAGRVKMLALTNRKVGGGAAKLATVAELGYPDLSIDGLVGVFSLKQMPKQVRDKIAADLQSVSQDPELERRLTTAGQVLNPGSAEEFSKVVEEQKAQAAAIGAELGIRPSTIERN